MQVTYFQGHRDACRADCGITRRATGMMEGLVRELRAQK